MSKGADPVDDGLLRALDLQKHRGPDDQGIVAFKDFWLGHNRLKIVDLAGAKQPMEIEGVILLFNGEIYNYRELRQQLTELGSSFTTFSDTEVLLRMYLQFGSGCVSKLRGMFAFCIVDTNVNEIFISRDLFGIKPLYYYMNSSQLIVSSEIKSILALINDNKVDKSALAHFLRHRYVPKDISIWQNIKKIQPGSYLKIDSCLLTVVSEGYYKVDPIAKLNLTNATKEFEKNFEDVVGMHLQADVPIGLSLSGGLDSTAIAIAAEAIGQKNLKCFTVGFENSATTNETKYASQVAEKLSFDLEEIVINEQMFIDGLQKHVRTLEEPNADLASIPLQYLCDRASKHVKVLVSGEGADEVLAGYDFEKRLSVWRLFRLMKKLPVQLQESLLRVQKISELLEVNGLDSVSTLTQNLLKLEPNMSNVFSAKKIKEIFDLQYKKYDQLSEVNSQDLDDTLNSAMLIAQKLISKSWLVEDLLMRSDKVSMQASIEMRVPFLEPAFASWCKNLPLNHKIRFDFKNMKYQNKYLLRRYCERRGFGKIVNRPKQGFSIPVYSWLNDRLKDWSQEMLTGSESRLIEVFNQSKIQQIYDENLQSGLIGQHRNWNLIIMELWLRENPDARI